ncbi:MAG TPA: AbrB/MazE/SpoVT family DNA-binding domain-containing protein [Rectinemataceae bacterium]|nr:AbrB/MazE/SpoVT family DNA-binding domain-containing protein [Rectinemataceae bacterium]
MLATVRKIGNSRGIIIPAALLATCGIESTVELSVEDGRLVIAASRRPREGWFEDKAVSDAAYEDTPLWDAAQAADSDALDKDWEW